MAICQLVPFLRPELTLHPVPAREGGGQAIGWRRHFFGAVFALSSVNQFFTIT